tara:strand:- start:666 stop:1067 length:402 start_codon:yes stop_codon:yes gene_type:complete
MASNITVDTISKGATVKAVDQIVDTTSSQICKAWVNFNGTLVAASMIRASYNVSSITDNGVGDYTVNFTTAMPDVNYSVSCGQCDWNNGRSFGVYDARSTFTKQLVSSVRVRNAAQSTDTLDIVNASVTIHSN